MKKGTLITVGVVGALVLAAGGGYAWSVANSATTVTTAVATVQPLTVTVSASGKVEAARTVGVYAPTSGVLVAVKVADGDLVAAGDTLAVMSRAPLRVQVAQAKAALSTARAQLEAISRGVPTSADRSAASAAVSAAESSLSTARKNYDDFADDYQDATHDERVVMLPTLRQLRSAKSQAYASVLAARAAVGQLSAAGRVQLDRVAAARSVTAATKALDQARKNLARTSLTAPVAGVVAVNGAVERGSAVSPAQPSFTVTNLNKLNFVASVNESDIAAVALDQKATISLDAFLESTFPGTVTKVRANALETATGGIAFPVRIRFDPGESRLFVGMSGSAEIEVESIEEALTVPIEAVLTEGDTRWVFVIGPDATAEKTAVTVGAANDTHTQILSGLTEGDVVVTSQITALTDGQSVKTL